MLIIRLESTLNDSYKGYYNKLFVFDSSTGVLKTYTRDPFQIENKDIHDILSLFKVDVDLLKPYKFIVRTSPS